MFAKKILFTHAPVVRGELPEGVSSFSICIPIPSAESKEGGSHA
jgi:hypothetical protein